MERGSAKWHQLRDMVSKESREADIDSAIKEIFKTLEIYVAFYEPSN